MPDEGSNQPETLVVAVSDDAPAVAAAHFAAALARHLDLGLSLFHVAVYSESDILRMKATRTGELELARSKALESLAPIRQALADEPFTEIVRLGEIGLEAAEISQPGSGVVLFVIGRLKRNVVSRVLLGRVGKDFMRSVSVPVLFVPPDARAPAPPWRWIVATDISEASASVIPLALRLGKAPGSELIVVHARKPNAVRDEAEQALKRWCEPLRANSIKLRRRSEVGDPLTVLAGVAEQEQACGIIVASHGRTAMMRVILGSVSERLLKKAPAPVLVVRAATE